MKEVSRGQALQVSARIGTQVKWDEIDGDQLQKKVINLSPEEFGRRFTQFLKDGCQFVFGDPKSILTKAFNPAEFLGKDWMVWKGPADGNGLEGEEDIDPRSSKLTEIEVRRFIFETCLEKDETSILGEEKLRRLKKKSFVRFDANVFYGLWLDYQDNKENSVLEWIYRNHRIRFIDFMGTILRPPNGHRNILCLNRNDDGEWRWDDHWLDNRWDDSEFSVGCARVP